MRSNTKALTALTALTLAACQAETRDPGNMAENETDQPAPTAPASPPAAADPSNETDANNAAPYPPPLEEPNGPIDPKSAEGAGQVVQMYGALVEQGRFNEASKLWSDATAARAFEAQLRAFRTVHMTIGDLGPIEGAAGSSYITEPVTFYGKTKTGADYSKKAVVTLRRVNDVPGSSAEQRRWHIQSIG